MLALFKNILDATRSRFESAETKSARFVDNFVEQDMLANGFGFGRGAVCRALKQLKVTNFDALFSLDTNALEYIRTAKGVGPKVFTGFQAYLAKRGVLPAAEGQEAIAVATTTASEAQEGTARIDVV